MRIIDNTSAGYRPMYIDMYKTHRDEIVAVVFSFRSVAENFHESVETANGIRRDNSRKGIGSATTATRLYRIRIKKFKLAGEKP